MSSKSVVCDAGPLIVLARTGQLSLLEHLFEERLLTKTIQHECLARPTLPGAQVIHHSIAEGLLRVVEPPTNPTLSEKLLQLDEGEKTAILLAAERNAIVLIDERRGRSVAAHLSLPVLGTAGLLLRAYKKGLIPSLQDSLEQMKDKGYRLSDALIQAMLEQGKIIRPEQPKRS